MRQHLFPAVRRERDDRPRLDLGRARHRAWCGRDAGAGRSLRRHPDAVRQPQLDRLFELRRRCRRRPGAGVHRSGRHLRCGPLPVRTRRPATNATTIDLSATPLTATYVQAAAGGGQGRRSFQIVRVLQHSSATLTGTVTASAWDGATGGVVVLDVAGALNWGGQGVNVTGLGFRGGAGRNRPSGDAALTNPYVTTDASGRHASKGEGIAGTPRYVHNDTNPTDTDRGTLVDNGAEGYPNGDFGRGAPGNAGGGGATVSNSGRDNGGGGGGGNGAAGGYGAYGWRGAGWAGIPASYAGIDDLRGAGGAAFGSPSSSRLVMGGGGGAGDGNNNTDDPIRSSGGAGGGIVMVRAGSISGAGTISADGARAPDQPGNDAAGGGGAGGSVIVIAQNNAVGSLTVNARGGRGGDSYITGNVAHGGGGGGGGGVVVHLRRGDDRRRARVPRATQPRRTTRPAARRTAAAPGRTELRAPSPRPAIRAVRSQVHAACRSSRSPSRPSRRGRSPVRPGRTSSIASSSPMPPGEATRPVSRSPTRCRGRRMHSPTSPRRRRSRSPAARRARRRRTPRSARRRRHGRASRFPAAAASSSSSRSTFRRTSPPARIRTRRPRPIRIRRERRRAAPRARATTRRRAPRRT